MPSRTGPANRLEGDVRASMDFHGAPPFRMEPGKNPQYANFHGTGRHDLHAPQAGIIYRRDVRRPHRTAGGDQASETLLRGNAQKITAAAGLNNRLCVGNVSRRRIQIAVTSLVPVDVIALIWFRHYASKSAIRTAGLARYVRNSLRRWNRLARCHRGILVEWRAPL